MKKTKILLLICCAAALMLGQNVRAGEYVKYLPYVNASMSRASFWSDKEADADRILADSDEIKRLNAKALSEKNAKMCDLKNQPESFDGSAFNAYLSEKLQKEKQSLLGWTYNSCGHKAEADFFDSMIAAAVDPDNAGKSLPVRYAVVSERSNLRAFPCAEPILDDPQDPDFDYQHYDSLRVNEPLLVYTASRDKAWYFVKSLCCSGWVSSSDIAMCKDKAEWLRAWDIPEDRLLVVYGDKIYLEKSNFDGGLSEKVLTMGTKLELIDAAGDGSLINNRSPYNNYAVVLPERLKDGSYARKAALISEHAKVNVGYLPLTKANIARVAFGALGNVYGWGGMLNTDDCSGFVRSVYKCFGLELARNTVCQAALPVSSFDLSELSDAEKENVIRKLPLGAVLFFKGHEMLYLGSDNGRYYVIDALSSMLSISGGSKMRVRSVVVNTLDIKRPSGKTWLSELNLANIPYSAKP